MSKNPIRVGLSPLSGNIYAGRLNKGGDLWIGEKYDVTSDCIGAVIQKIGINNCISVNENGIEKYEITVREIKTLNMPVENITSFGYCRYEEADGELLEQCKKCKAVDAEKNHE